MPTRADHFSSHGVAGSCFLVVEDNFLVADTLCRDLRKAGATVVGPCATVDDALELLDQEGVRIDAAILDVNLRGQRSYPVADALTARGLPFVFVTGYGSPSIDSAFAMVPRCEKPLDAVKLTEALKAACSIVSANDAFGREVQ